VAPIVLRGGAWFAAMGTERSKGTKVFAVSGDVARPGVYEMLLGSSLRELIEELAGASDVKLVQVGGATGRIYPYESIDMPLSFESCLGAGAVTVFNKSRDVMEIVGSTVEFLAEESCGKCTPCRQGTRVMVEVMERFRRGEGLERDLEWIPVLADTMALSSLCGLGQAAPFVMLDTLKYFRDDYLHNLRDSRRVAQT
jgi:NADH:ubiquinone oxidoreductase subunit F (NADH-binding)